MGTRGRGRPRLQHPVPRRLVSGTGQMEVQEEQKTSPPMGGKTGVAGKTAGRKAGRTTSSSPAKPGGTSPNVQKKTPAQPKTGQRPKSQ